MALLAFEKAPFSAIFSLSIQMSSNQVNVAPETADGAIVAGPGPKSCLAKEIRNGALRKSAKKRHLSRRSAVGGAMRATVSATLRPIVPTREQAPRG